MKINKLFLAALLISGANSVQGDQFNGYYQSETQYSSPYFDQGNSYPYTTDYNYSYPYSSGYDSNYSPYRTNYESSNYRIDSSVTPSYNYNSSVLQNERNVPNYNRYNQTNATDSNLNRNPKSFTDKSITSEYKYGYATPSDASYSATDADLDLRKKIQTSIGSSDFAKYVTVDVDNGIVTLRGKVRNQNERSAIEQKIKNVQGVKNVNNQIEIK